MKKLSKLLSIIVLALMLLTITSNIVLAKNETKAATTGIDPSNVQPSYADSSKVTAIGGKIVGFIQLIGSVAAVAVLAILGIKYMMGSTEEKAEYKKTLMPYLIGAILIFGAVNIASAVYSNVSNI